MIGKGSDYMDLTDKIKEYLYSRLKSSIFIRKTIKQSKLSNLYLAQIFLNKRIENINNNLPKFPPKLIIENTNICNAACVMCPYKKMTRKKGVMSFELFKKIIDEYSSSTHTKRLQMNNMGEPLIDPLIVRKIKYAKEKGIEQVFFFTNGSLLDKQLTEKLIDSGLDYMIISLDGITKETYEKVRKNLKFEEVINNIENFMILRRERRADRPKIELHITLLNENRSDEKEFVKKMKNMADYVSVTYAHDWAGQQEAKNIEYIQKSHQLKLAPCSNLWSELTILWDGRVALCCIDYEGKVILGDVNRESLQNIWKCEKLRMIREYHLKRQFDQIELCKKCSEHIWANWWLDYWE